jgi:hypothetical protein
MPDWWNKDDDNDGKSNREERQIEKEEDREEQRAKEEERWKKQMQRDSKDSGGGDNDKKKKKGGNIPGVPTPIEPPAQQQSEDYSALKTTSSLLPAVPDFNKLISSIQSGSNPTATFWAVLVLGWVLFGIAGFLMSLWCIGFTGNFGEKFIGVIIAMILGPWYWLYFYSVPTYCARLPPPSLF